MPTGKWQAWIDPTPFIGEIFIKREITLYLN